MRRVFFIREFVVAFCLLTITQALMAQSGRGTLTGVVKDAQGSLAPGVELVATNTANGEQTRAATTSSGVYRMPYLEPGNYKVTASLKGFKTAIRDNVNVLLAQTVTLDFTLEVGEVREMVTVTSESPLLEASTAEIGINASGRDVHSWPVFVSDGTRQLQDFVFRAMPGTEGNTFEGTINGGQTFSHEILIEGISLGRMDLNGGSNNEFTATMDAVSEFRLQTGALSSQYGNTQTAVVNFGLKSGTNTLHGTLFWFNQTNRLNAASWTCKASPGPDGQCHKQTVLLNNFGATAGGPLKKNRTHWFFSYEGHRQSDWSTSGSLSLPIGAFKKGDFSKLFDPNFTLDSRSGTVVGKDALGRDVRFGQIYDPATSRQLPDGTWIRDPFPDNIIPQDRFSRVTENILNYDLPDPQRMRLFNNNPRGKSTPRLTIDNWEGKIDHVINKRHKASGALIYNDRSRSLGYKVPGLPIPGPAMVGDFTQATPGYMVRLSEDWTIGPTRLNHMALGYNRFRNAILSNANISGVDWKASLGMEGVGTHSFPRICFDGPDSTLSGGYLGAGRCYGANSGSNSPNGSTIFLDDFTWIRGAHSFRLGGELRRYYTNDQTLQDTGSYVYHNEQTGLPGSSVFGDSLNATGFAYASFLLGAAQSADNYIPLLTDGMRSQTLAVYLQDDWKVNPRLTLNLGLRWDIPTPLYEVRSRMSGLDPGKPNPGADGYRGAFVVLGNGSGRTGQKNFSSTYYRNFGPRIGFAYAPTSKMVLRGGYGINYSPPIADFGAYGGYFNGFNGDNVINRRELPYVGVPAYSWDAPYPPFKAVLPNTEPTLLNGQDIPYYAADLNIGPMVQNWNFGIQYELPWQTRIEANFIGNHGSHLNNVYYLGSLNQVPFKFLSLGDTLLDDIRRHPEIPKPYPSFSGTVSRALRPFPQYESVTSHRSNNDWSNYNSLQVTLIKRASRGLSFLISYTFSKALASSDSAAGGYSSGPQDFYNRKADYSVTNYNCPQDLKLTWIYDLPFGSKGKWMRSGVGSYVLGGWTLSAIQRYQSGAPLSLGQGGFEYAALFNPGWRPDIVLARDLWVLPGGTPINPDPLAGTPYLNPNAFAPVPTSPKNVPIHFGNSPRFLSNLRGSAIYGEDLSLVKRTYLPFREGMNFELRLDIRNLFNRIGICDPSTDVNDPVRFGRVFGKCGDPRLIQWGARFTF